MSFSFAKAERARLRDLLLDVGPDAPTLCEGWKAEDLAAHLLVRETRPDAAAGMFAQPLAGHLDSVTKKVKDQGFENVVKRWGAGPSRFSPVRLFDSAMNTAEHFVHYEDLRRGQAAAGGEVPQPREFSAAVNEQLWKLLRRFAPMMLGKSALTVVLQPDGLIPITAKRVDGVADQGDDVVRVSGPVGELLLWTYGRDAVHVDVQVPEGAPADAMVRNAI